MSERLTGKKALVYGGGTGIGLAFADALLRAGAAVCVSSLGGLDTIVISAGAGGRTAIFDTDPAVFQRIIDTNLRPAFLPMRYAAEHLVSPGSASVIIISSTFGLVGYPERAAYCAAKAGIIGLVKSAALDFADKGVRVKASVRDMWKLLLLLKWPNANPIPRHISRSGERCIRSRAAEDWGKWLSWRFTSLPT